MPFALIFTLYEFLVAKWFAYVMTVHEHMKNKEICNDAMERAKAIDMKNAEQRVRDDRAREICELIDQSEMVKSLWTRVVMLGNCIQQHELRVRQLETEKAVLEKRIYFDRMIICFLYAGLILVNRGI